MGGSLNELGIASEVFHSFVETGTYLGDTTRRIARQFRTVYTIELSKEIFETTRTRLSGLTNVVFINGDSAAELKRLCNVIEEPAVFFLDAHYAGGKTAFGEKEVPLYEELEAIAKRKWCDLVILDDFRLFGKTGKSGSDDSEMYPTMTFDWRDITLEGCLDIFKKHQKSIDYVTLDDRVYVLKPGEGRAIKTIADLKFGEPLPILSTAPQGASVVLSAQAATDVEGISFNTEYGPGLAATPPEAVGIFSLSFEFECAASVYDVWSLYAADERRPLNLFVDGILADMEIAASTTGGWYQLDLMWHQEKSLSLSQGKHHFQVCRAGPFPHLARLALVKQ